VGGGWVVGGGISAARQESVSLPGCAGASGRASARPDRGPAALGRGSRCSSRASVGPRRSGSPLSGLSGCALPNCSSTSRSQPPHPTPPHPHPPVSGYTRVLNSAGNTALSGSSASSLALRYGATCVPTQVGEFVCGGGRLARRTQLPAAADGWQEGQVVSSLGSCCTTASSCRWLAGWRGLAGERAGRVLGQCRRHSPCSCGARARGPRRRAPWGTR
jgi:hypothetical protein